ncbi:MAG: BamA/TamA family outer membrane protein [Chloroherpetonaceae bacterium]|nr:BamA/TamA family outer membrane protein [Chloroherpetonaceae bacterium]
MHFGFYGYTFSVAAEHLLHRETFRQMNDLRHRDKFTKQLALCNVSFALSMLLAFSLWAALAAAQVPTTSPTLTSVRLVGAQQLASSSLSTLFSLPAPLDSLSFHAALNRLRDIYLRLGYYDFQLNSVRWVYSPDSSQVHAEVFFTEGKPTRIGEIHLVGNRTLSTDALRFLMRTHEGDALDSETLEQDFNAILEKYEELGRPFSKISIAALERVQNKASEPVLRLVICVQEGALVKIAGYKFSDSLNTQPETILRELSLKIGEPYSERKFLSLQPRLERLGWFEKVSEPELLVIPPQHKDSDTLYAIIRLDLVEGHVNTFDGIVGYQPPIPPEEAGIVTGFVHIGLRNLFGTGRQLGVRWLRPNNFTQELRLSYQEPWILGIPLTATFNVMQLQQDSSFSQLLLSSALSYQLSEQLSVSGLLQLETINPIFQGTARIDPILQSSITLTGAAIAYDSRDNLLNPSSGIYFRNEYRIGTKTLNASDSLLQALQVRRSVVQQRLSLEAEWYQPTFLRQVFALRLVGQALLAEEVQLSDLFRFGGAQTLRGYREQEFLASRYAFLNLEYRLQLSPKSFAFVFYDVGYFFKPQNPLNPLDRMQEGWRKGFGAGARIDTPLGIVGISYALGEGDTILRGKVHFNLLNQF